MITGRWAILNPSAERAARGSVATALQGKLFVVVPVFEDGVTNRWKSLAPVPPVEGARPIRDYFTGITQVKVDGKTFTRATPVRVASQVPPA